MAVPDGNRRRNSRAVHHNDCNGRCRTSADVGLAKPAMVIVETAEDVRLWRAVQEAEEKEAETEENPQKESFTKIDIPITGNERKPWMDYRTVTDQTTRQWEIIQDAIHLDNGLLMTKDGYYLAALGSNWGQVGQRYRFYIGGKSVKIIKADEKQDQHTADSSGWTGMDGHIMEMVVDTDYLDIDALYHGDCNWIPELSGEVTNAEVKDEI